MRFLNSSQPAARREQPAQVPTLGDDRWWQEEVPSCSILRRPRALDALGCRFARGAVLARVVDGGFEDPSREVGWVHVASAQDRGDAPPGEPLRILEDGGDAKRC